MTCGADPGAPCRIVSTQRTGRTSGANSGQTRNFRGLNHSPLTRDLLPSLQWAAYECERARCTEAAYPSPREASGDPARGRVRGRCSAAGLCRRRVAGCSREAGRSGTCEAKHPVGASGQP
jgi:hypothetical protein